MKIALFGANGTIGARILNEALTRGHAVTALLRDPSKLKTEHSGLSTQKADVLDSGQVAQSVAGHEVIISALGPGALEASTFLMDSAKALVEGARKAGVKRLLVVGGAGSLEVAPGLRLVDSPQFPAAWKTVALAHCDLLDYLRTTGLDWTSLSPAALIEPGQRTGIFRTGLDQFLADGQGNSRISAEDYAVAMLDEAERPAHPRKRFTVAY
jgi:hypothetical protein